MKTIGALEIQTFNQTTQFANYTPTVENEELIYANSRSL